MSVRLVIAEVEPATINVSAFCRDHGISRQTFYALRKRIQAEGPGGLEVRSRAPYRVANRTPERVEDRIVEIRKTLAGDGFDAGAETIRWHLEHESDPSESVPSVSTIYRVLVRRGFVTAEPKKSPRRRWTRFAAERANECWQMDSFAYPLQSGTFVDVINVLDDCTRLATDGLVVPTCTAHDAWAALERSAERYGWPQRVLRDNASVFRANTDALAQLGIEGIHSRPYHPQTCGKVERYQQTLKKYLALHGPYPDLDDLQAAVDAFCDYYNHHRPHRGIDRQIPAAAWAGTPKSGPSQPQSRAPLTRARTCTVYNGRISIAGNRIQLGIEHDHRTVTVMLTGLRCHIFHHGRLLRELTIDPTRTTQPLHDRPGRPT